MKPYTVLLLYPDYASGNFGHETYLAHVTAADPTAAILAARQQCDADYRRPNRDEADGFNDLEDLFVHAVFAGHHDDLKP